MGQAEMLERIARLEEKCDEIGEIKKTQTEILAQLNQYKGAWGILLMVLTALAAGGKILLEKYWK